MNKNLKSILFWAPRGLGILFTLFISLLALDIFDMDLGFWDTVVGLFMHLLPSIAIAIALALAWRWEWVGAAFFAVSGGWFFYIQNPTGDVMYYIVMVGVPFLIAALFLAGWFKRSEIRG